MKMKSYGKINLSLEVLNKRQDGFHNIDTIMQFVDIYDEIDVTLSDTREIEIICNEEGFPLDESNLIYKAWDSLKDYYKGSPGVRVEVKKNLPIAAGIGGGSSNCACVMDALNKLWNLNLSKEKLQLISSSIGSDVPYFFENTTKRAKGRGFDFYDMIELSGISVIIINNGYKISTPEVYSKVELSKKGKMDKLIDSLNKGELDKSLFFNTMTQVSVSICPEIENIIDELYELNADVSLMSGSGPTVFGIFKSKADCDRAYEKLKGKYKYVFNTKTIRRDYEG